MIKPDPFRQSLPFLALATACAQLLRAQEAVPSVDPQPVTLSRQEAKGLLWVHSAPHYPVLAKVNYIQGAVELEMLLGVNSLKAPNACDSIQELGNR